MTPAGKTILALLVLMFCMLPGVSQAENLMGSERKPARADFGRLVGKWLRSDSGHVLEVRDAKPDGRLIVLYVNPKPVNVSKAEWLWMGESLMVFIEFQDANRYTLAYVPDGDSLKGTYYQSLPGQKSGVVFKRAKAP